LIKQKQFASDVIDTIDYGESNQFNKEKIKQDHFISKLVEEAVKKAFEKFGKVVKGQIIQFISKKKNPGKKICSLIIFH
jgi:hypothetical protein